MNASSRSRQEGYTLVELMIALSVTAAVLVGLGGVVFAVNGVTTAWKQRTYLAQATGSLAVSLQADSHRLLPCSGDGPELDLCLPGATSGAPPVARYGTVPTTCASGGALNLVRTEVASGATSTVARCLLQQPAFHAVCSIGPGAATGYVEVQGLMYPNDSAPPAPQPPLYVYFRSPLGSCGS